MVTAPICLLLAVRLNYFQRENNSSVLRLTHHHLAELVEVHGTAAVLVQFGDDPVQLLVSQGGEELGNQPPQDVHGDEALALLVVDPEGVLELPLHGVDVRVLHQELGAQLAELSELDLPGAVLVNLSQDVHQLLLGGSEAHGPKDLVQVVSGEEVLLLGVEQVEAESSDFGATTSWRAQEYIRVGKQSASR